MPEHATISARPARRSVLNTAHWPFAEHASGPFSLMHCSSASELMVSSRGEGLGCSIASVAQPDRTGIRTASARAFSTENNLK